MNALHVITCLLLIATLHATVLCDFELPDGWVDPGNMLTFDPVLKKNQEMKKKTDKSESIPQQKKNIAEDEEVAPVTKEKKSPERPIFPTPNPPISEDKKFVDSEVQDVIYFRKFIAFLLDRLSKVGKPPYYTQYDASMKLEEKQWEFFQRFVENSDGLSVQDVLAKLEASFQDFVPSQQQQKEKWKFEDCFNVSAKYAVEVLAITVSEIFLEPLVDLGTASSKLFKNMFSELSVQLWIPEFIFVIISMVALLLLLTVYRYIRCHVSRHQVENVQNERLIDSQRRLIEQMQNTIDDLSETLRQAIEPAQNNYGQGGNNLPREEEEAESDFLPDNRSTSPVPPASPLTPRSNSSASTVPSSPVSDSVIQDFPMPPMAGGEASGVRRRNNLPYPPERPIDISTTPRVRHHPEGDTTFSTSSHRVLDSIPGNPCPVESSTSDNTSAETLGQPPPYTPTDTNPGPRREIGFRREIIGDVEPRRSPEKTHPKTPPVVEEIEVRTDANLTTASADVEFSSFDFVESEVESFN